MPRAASGKAMEASTTSPNAPAASRPGRSAHSLNTPSTTHATAHVVMVTAATKKWRVASGSSAAEKPQRFCHINAAAAVEAAAQNQASTR